MLGGDVDLLGSGAVTTAPGTRIAVVDDHELLAESLAVALSRRGLTAVAVRPTGPSAVLEGVAAHRADLVLLDFDLGPVGPASPLVSWLRELGATVVVLTGATSRVVWAECVEAGAVAVVHKSASFDELVDQVVRIAESGEGIGPVEREVLLAELRAHRSAVRARVQPFERLTPREGVVLGHLLDGRNAEEIAAGEFVSITTVRTQIHSILQKLGVGSQLAAVGLARRSGWCPPVARCGSHLEFSESGVMSAPEDRQC